MIKYITSVNNTHHIGLYNYRNAYCHYTSVIQRLHSSPILTKELLKSHSHDSICSTLNASESEKSLISTVMYPVYIYATYDTTNDIQIYEALRSYFTDYDREYIAESAKNGYLPQYVMCFVFLPIICKLYPNKFELILRELTMDVIDFINIESAADSVLIGDQAFFRSNEHRNIMKRLYFDMVNNHLPKQIMRNSFCSAVLEVFPNRESTGGHAITLIKARDNVYYIIDDQNRISLMEDYYRERKSRLYRISIRDIDEETVANINAILHARCKIDPSSGIDLSQGYSKRVTRYELNFEHNFKVTEEAVLLKDDLASDTEEGELSKSEPMKDEDIVSDNDITYHKSKSEEFSMSGGDIDNYYKYVIIMGIFIGIIVIGVVVGLVIYYLKNHQERFEEIAMD